MYRSGGCVISGFRSGDGLLRPGLWEMHTVNLFNQFNNVIAYSKNAVAHSETEWQKAGKMGVEWERRVQNRIEYVNGG